MDKNKIRNLLIRSISGAAMLVIMLGALFLSEYTFLALLIVLGVGIMREFFKLSAHGPSRTTKWLAWLAGSVLIASVILCQDGKCLMALLPLTALIFIVELYRGDETPLENISVTVCGIAYAAVPMALLAAISEQGGEYEPLLVLVFFVTVWINDVFAYLVGMSIGRRRLMERISPKKSWEGFWGGVIFATAFTAITGHLTGNNWLICGGFGLLVAVTSVFGDLVESMFKRAAGVKDSGNIIPGHGGFMDRFDAMLVSLPFAYCYYELLTPFTF